ncbi:phosphodiester glycosidase family protein [Dyella nitratireducens]|uniref:Phosphodiester glycosidase domain-containing protein n=1 Tax=Dyella nitratireducens TaxID=1849580 RepID=A0ABQ1GL22_9GAMM|nr:phosphodiester glycosidase family protein [Dyella nitratireducens]GGA45341.1 hypothetical protein GCM10010981_38040 [Dyella nitratireducens]GLQ41306.1 hypothetical protein GCM10007902_11560 [Dyella nitratireducens]
MFCKRPLSALLHACLATGLAAGIVHAGDSLPASSSSSATAIPVVASSTCWDMQPGDVLAALRQCTHKHMPFMTLAVRQGADGQLYAATDYATDACQPSAACVPLSEALHLQPAPHLLLQAAPSTLDDLQAAIRDAAADTRVLVQPMLQRPTGNSSPITIRSGLRYWHQQATQPRPMMIHILEISLDTRGLAFVVTPGTPKDGNEFVVEKTTHFAAREQLDAAINATYFRPFDGGHLLDKPYVPALGQGVVVDGISMAHGHVDSDYTSPDTRSNGSLCMHGHDAYITTARCSTQTTEAVGAGPVLMLHGKPLPLENKRHDYYATPEPRTAIALDKARKKMWWVVVDGRQSNYSEGMTLSELTSLLQQLGADSAINMDGGGSSTMVLRQDGKFAIANSPIHTGIPGRERPVGNHLGIRIDVLP